MNKILERLKEPSSWAGLAALLASLGLLGLTESDWNTLLAVPAAIAAAAAVLVKEKGPS